jgi:mxaJ protein
MFSGFLRCLTDYAARGGFNVLEGRLRAAGVALALLSLLLPAAAEARELRVCADPNNLPYSNEAGEGFENKIVAILAEELDAEVTYTWWAQRRGFFRNTVQAGLCDLVPGVVFGMDGLRTSRPYYRSGYVFVTRDEGGLHVSSLDDPALRTARVGVQLVGDDGSNTPPAHALARRGIIDNVRGYMVQGDYSQASPGGAIIRAVAESDIDVAIVWGPLAAYLAAQSTVPLEIALVRPEADGPLLPMAFDISMGVRWQDQAFRDEIDTALVDRRADIDRILEDYAVPRLDRRAAQAGLAP